MVGRIITGKGVEMDFEIRASKGNWKEYPYRYSVYLDDKEVWTDDYASERNTTQIFVDFVKAIYENGETVNYVLEVLKERSK